MTTPLASIHIISLHQDIRACTIQLVKLPLRKWKWTFCSVTQKTTHSSLQNGSSCLIDYFISTHLDCLHIEQLLSLAANRSTQLAISAKLHIIFYPLSQLPVPPHVAQSTGQKLMYTSTKTTPAKTCLTSIAPVLKLCIRTL